MSNYSIVLAAGKGTRMKSSLPKVAHKIAGASMMWLVMDEIASLSTDTIVLVVSEELESWMDETNFLEEFHDYAAHKYGRKIALELVLQKERLGTAHAVKTALDNAATLKNVKSGKLIIAYADTPLVKQETMKNLLVELENSELSILSFINENPTNSYGRVIAHEANLVKKIVEFKDASEAEKKISLCNSGIIAADIDFLKNNIDKIKTNNAAGEYYLTDIVRIASDMEKKVTTITCPEEEVMGVNSKLELSQAEAIWQKRMRESFMLNGVTIIDPASTFFSYDTKIENDVTIYPNIFVGPNVEISKGTIIYSFSFLEGVKIGKDCKIGPFARIRPDSKIEDNCKIGNFVEIKKSHIGKETSIGHISYIGDSEIGKDVNIGAGTITCNYNGISKHKTIIGDHSFVGSSSIFIAPVEVGSNAMTAAGSVISKNVSDGELAITRGEQKNIADGTKRIFSKLKDK